MTASIGYGIILTSKNIKDAAEKVSKGMSDHEKKLQHFYMSPKYYEGLSDEAKKFMAELNLEDLEKLHKDRDTKQTLFLGYLEDHYPLLTMIPVGMSDTAVIVKTSHRETGEYDFVHTSSIAEEEKKALADLVAKISYTWAASWIFWNS